MKLKRSKFLAVLVVFLITISAGCNRQKVPEIQVDHKEDIVKANEPLVALLPPEKGYTWVYNGFAEYSSKMTLDKIDKNDEKITYDITGEVEDVSEGEGTADLSIELQYIIQDGTLTQIKKSEVMLDSEYNTLQLIKMPLQKGTKWNQEVTDKKDKKTTLECEITNVEKENGNKIYTVHYHDQNSKYYEKRHFKEGTGIISFEKLWINGNGEMPIGYAMYDAQSIERLNGKIPAYTKEKLQKTLQDDEYNLNITWAPNEEYVTYATYDMANKNYIVYFSSIYMKGEIPLSDMMTELPDIKWSDDSERVIIDEKKEGKKVKTATINIGDVLKTIKTD